ncbi:BnaA02g25300D [Brassica napus]|uniref:BnaA02g25300D protein n=1 Tax=Brassica napus TaxID=3708 RepID=A0A078GTU4_BRANA|nr:BnaA02g25300D [Brassica napus]
MVKECIDNYMSKDETQRYLQSWYQFARQDINDAWGLLERKKPDSLRLHNERIRERNPRTCERVASST